MKNFDNKIDKIKLIALAAFVLFIAPAHAVDTNVSQLYVWNGTNFVYMLAAADGTVNTDINLTESTGLSPRLNNTFSSGIAALQWANVFATNVRSAGPLSIYAGGSEKITISAGGNVGIGNTDPQQALVVNGQANVTGTLVLNGTTNIRGVLYNWPSADGTVNQRLTTNGTGGLTWTNFTGSGASNYSAVNVSSGSFGAEVGGGFYSFPSNISVSQNISASGRVTDKTGYVVPVGSVAPFSGALAPAGWLIANGSEVNRTTYPDLFNITGTRYGNTTDSTFKLPDLRQRFVLGVADTGTGSTLGGTGGSIDHTHTGPSHTHGYSTVIAHTHAVDPPSTASDSTGSHSHSVDYASTSTSSDGSHMHDVNPPSASVSISDPGHSHTERGNSVTSGSTMGSGSGDITVTVNVGSTTTGVSASLNVGAFDSSSDGGHTHAIDVGATTSSTGGGHTHSTDIASFTSGSTGSASGTMDASGTGATGTGNPPFIVVNYIIKY